MSVDVCDCAAGAVFYFSISTDNRLSCVIFYCTGNSGILCRDTSDTNKE